MSTITGRFAPSPTGYMHLGNAAAAVISYLDCHWLAQRESKPAKWLVRIEDIDRERCKPHFTQALLEDLEWLGLTPDEEPVRQSERSAIYQEALERLEQKGLTYKCYCTRASRMATGAPQEGDETLEENGYRPVLIHRSECNATQSAAAPSIRFASPTDVIDSYNDLRMGTQQKSIYKAVPDPILCRRDGLWGYQLCCTLDDALQGVSIVTRGADLAASAHLQRFIMEQLDFTPPIFAHIPLIKTSDGERETRMAKRNGENFTIKHMREVEGKEPAEVLAMIGRLYGLLPQDNNNYRQNVTIQELLRTHKPTAQKCCNITI